MANSPGFFICEAHTDDGPRAYVTILPPKVTFTQGLIPKSIVGTLPVGIPAGQPIDPESFIANTVFKDFLHEIIARHAPQEAGFKEEARERQGGLVVVTDCRTPKPEGPVPTEDIFGIFEIPLSGTDQPTYQRNPNHRLLTLNGFFQLPGELHQRLLEALAALMANR